MTEEQDSPHPPLFYGEASASGEGANEGVVSVQTRHEAHIRLAEYRALREEILSKMESQRQYISLVVIAVGTSLWPACKV